LAEVRTLKARYTLATVKLALSKYRERDPRRRSPRPTNLIPLDPEAFIQTALELLSSDRYLQKGMGLMTLTGRRLP
jgi:hypothetical protein